jgi:MFS family permease
VATQRRASGRATRLSRRSRQALAALAVVSENPQLRRVAIARVASVTGRWASTIALAVFAYNAGGATYVGVLGVVRILPAALAGPLAAGLLDRVRADRLLLAAGVGRTLAIGAAGVALIGGANAAPVFVLVSVESLLSTMVRPLQTSALPFLARTPGELTAANLSLTTVESVGMLLGPALGGLLLTTWDPGGVLLVTAVAYLVSTLLIARIPAWQAVGPTGQRGPGVGAAFGGLRAIRADPRLRLVVGLYCAQNVVTGALNVLVVISALTLLQLGESGVGELNAAIGVGGVVGAVAAVALLRRSRIASGFGMGLVLCGVPLVVIAAHPSTIPAILLLAVLGVGVTIVDFSAVTLLQRAIHEDALAKAFSVLQSLFVGSLGLGAALAPLLVSWLGIRGALLASGVVLPLLVAVLWGRLLRLDSSGLLADDAVNLLRSVPIFAPLELASLERLARTALAVEVEAGRTIVAEGEIGDRYYVVRAGELEVSAGGAPLRVLRGGEGFGEIALLREVPRTATVVALTDTKLFALDREHFLDAVNGSPSSREAADTMIDMRLGSLRAGLGTV